MEFCVFAEHGRVVFWCDDAGLSTRGIVVEEVCEAGEHLGVLEGPDGAVPLALWVFAFVPVLSHVVLVTGLSCTEPGGAGQLAAVEHVAPGLGVLDFVVGEVVRPGDHAGEFASADGVPVGNVLVVDFEAVDEVLECRVPECVLYALLERVRSSIVRRNCTGQTAFERCNVGDCPGVGVLVAVDCWSE